MGILSLTSHIFTPEPIHGILIRACGICCLRLDDPGVIRTTEAAFMVQPMEAGRPLLIAVIAEDVLER